MPVEGVLASIRLVSKESKISLNNGYKSHSKGRFNDDEIIDNMFNRNVLTGLDGNVKLMFEVVGTFKYGADWTYEDWQKGGKHDNLYWMLAAKTDYYRILDTPEMNTVVTQLDEVRKNAAKNLDECLESIVKQSSTLKVALEGLQINSLRDFDTILNNVHIEKSNKYKSTTGLRFRGCIRAWKEITPDIDLELELIFDDNGEVYGKDIEKLKPLLDFQDKVNKAGLTAEFLEDNLDEVVKDVSKLPDNIDIKFTNLNKNHLIQQVSENAEDLKFIKNQLVDDYQAYLNARLSAIIDDRKIDAEACPMRQEIIRMSVEAIED